MVRNSVGRYTLFTLMFTFALGAQAYAADAPLAVVTAPTFAGVSFAGLEEALPPVTFRDAAVRKGKTVDGQLPGAPAKVPAFAGSRPKMLPLLYVSLASLNVMDAITTSRGLSSGATEANPLMKGIVGNTPAMFAVKAASTAVSIWMSERLWMKNRVGAIATMVAVNAATGIIVMHNQAVINRVR